MGNSTQSKKSLIQWEKADIGILKLIIWYCKNTCDGKIKHVKLCGVTFDKIHQIQVPFSFCIKCRNVVGYEHKDVMRVVREWMQIQIDKNNYPYDISLKIVPIPKDEYDDNHNLQIFWHSKLTTYCVIERIGKKLHLLLYKG